jgi:hypothetical protein
MLYIAATAQAQSIDECQTDIATLRQQTVEATSFTNPKDQAGLVGKLDSASRKLSEGKTTDALANLTSFRDRVGILAAQGKLGQAEADMLIAGANDAISCVQGSTTA